MNKYEQIYVCMKRKYICHFQLPGHRKYSRNLKNWSKIVFIVQQMEYFFIRTVKRVFEDSENTFRIAVSVVKQPSGFFRDHLVFIFR